MKLYNIYEEIILEEITRNNSLISESVSPDKIKAAIDAKYGVNIEYIDYEGQPPSKRYILPLKYGQTKGGNYAIEAYQILGASKKGNEKGFKLFRVDRIVGWYPTNYAVNVNPAQLDPKGAYNPSGNRNMKQVNYMRKK